MPDLMGHLESKTVMGLTVLLLAVILLALVGKLTPEAVDALKWIGASYMAVRTSANIGENFGNKK